MTGLRETAGLGHPNEQLFGFSQATKAAGIIFVAGQVARDEGKVPPGLTFDQKFEKAAAKVDEALAKLGSAPRDAVWSQVYLTTPLRSAPDAVGDLCRRHLGGQQALTIARVPTLNDPAFEVEIATIAVREDLPMHRRQIGLDDPVDQRLGRARAVRAGNLVFLSGQPAVDAAGNPPPSDDFGTHFAWALHRLGEAVEMAGGTRSDIVWIHYFVTESPDPTVFSEVVSQEHRAYFEGGNRPATAMIGVTELAIPGVKVEAAGFAVLE